MEGVSGVQAYAGFNPGQIGPRAAPLATDGQTGTTVGRTGTDDSATRPLRVGQDGTGPLGANQSSDAALGASRTGLQPGGTSSPSLNAGAGGATGPNDPASPGAFGRGLTLDITV